MVRIVLALSFLLVFVGVANAQYAGHCCDYVAGGYPQYHDYGAHAGGYPQYMGGGLVGGALPGYYSGGGPVGGRLPPYYSGGGVRFSGGGYQQYYSGGCYAGYYYQQQHYQQPLFCRPQQPIFYWGLLSHYCPYHGYWHRGWCR